MARLRRGPTSSHTPGPPIEGGPGGRAGRCGGSRRRAVRPPTNGTRRPIPPRPDRDVRSSTHACPVDRCLPSCSIGLAASFCRPPCPLGAASIQTSPASAESPRTSPRSTANRTAVGLVPLRTGLAPACRLPAPGRRHGREETLRATTQPDGRDVFDILTANGITWFGAGEIIAQNTTPTLQASTTARTTSGWTRIGTRRHHRLDRLQLCRRRPGGSPDGGQALWTACSSRARIGRAQRPALGTSQTVQRSRTKRVTVSWSGADVPLQVLTSGFRYFKVERRTDGGDGRAPARRP